MRRFHLLLCLLIANAPSLHAGTPIASAAFSGGDQGQIVVEAKVNGKGLYPFVFDTGSVNVLSLDLANQLGVTMSGKRHFNAFGVDRDVFYCA